MISHKSWKYILLTVNSGYFWKCYAFNVQKIGKSYVTIVNPGRHTTAVKCTTVLTILVDFLFVAVFLWGTLILNTNPALKIIGIGAGGMFLVFAGMSLWHLIYMDQINDINLQVTAFFEKLCKIIISK